MKMIRKGEYDLVDISLIGFDPNTDKTYEQCHDEWRAEYESTKRRYESLRWWQWIESLRCRWQFVVLTEKLGM